MNSLPVTGVVPVVLPPTDGPAIDDPMLELARTEREHQAWQALAWLAAYVGGAALLHWALKSPFTGATLLAYGLFVVTFPIQLIVQLCGLRIGHRQRKWLGTRRWRWIKPDELTTHGNSASTVLESADGSARQDRSILFIMGLTTLARHYGVWVVHDGGNKARVRLPGSLDIRHESVMTAEEARPVTKAAQSAQDTAKRPQAPGLSLGSLLTVEAGTLLVLLGLPWIALGDPADAFAQQPATVIVILLACIGQLAGIPRMLTRRRRLLQAWDPETWHPVPITVTEIGFDKPWQQFTLRGTVTLSDGTAIPVRIRGVQSDLAANIKATGTLWVIDAPRPGLRTLAGVPGLALSGQSTFSPR